MTRKIKFQAFRIMFSLFDYQIEKSGGWRVYVRPIILVGILTFWFGLTIGGMAQNTEQKSKINSLNNKNRISQQEKDTTLNFAIFHINEDNYKDIAENCCCVVEESLPKLVIYDFVNKMPQFPGGGNALLKFINRNLKYPISKEVLQGEVICKFIVNKDGSVSNPFIMSSLEPEFDMEALRIVKSLPKFIPGKQNGKKVMVWYTLPIIFKHEK